MRDVKPKAVIVAGMHRSGTSAMARTLSLCGLDLPRTLVPARSDNPDGFWESAEVLRLNDQLLQKRGLAWDDVLSSIPERAQVRSEAIAAICDVVRHEFSLTHDFVLKDPRLSVLFPVWTEALQQVDTAPCAVIMVRNPLEVIDSLMSRDGFPRMQSALLWLAHFIAAERDTRELPRIFVGYENLISNWREIFSQIESNLGLSLDRQYAGELAIDKLLTHSKRHHVHSAADLGAHRDLPHWISDAYHWALAATRGEDPKTDALDEVAKEFHASARVFAPLLTHFRSATTPSSPEALPPGAFHITLYSATTNALMSEDTAVHATVMLGREPQTLSLATAIRNEPLTALRLDPATRLGHYVLHHLALIDAESDTPFWEWDGEPAFFNKGLGIIANAIPASGAALLEFIHEDPQITFLPATFGGRSRVKVELTLSYIEPLAVERLRLAQVQETGRHSALIERLLELEMKVVSDLRELRHEATEAIGALHPTVEQTIHNTEETILSRIAELPPPLAASDGIVSEIQRLIESGNQQLTALSGVVSATAVHSQRLLTKSDAEEAAAETRARQTAALLSRRLESVSDQILQHLSEEVSSLKTQLPHRAEQGEALRDIRAEIATVATEVRSRADQLDTLQVIRAEIAALAAEVGRDKREDPWRQIRVEVDAIATEVKHRTSMEEIVGALNERIDHLERQRDNALQTATTWSQQVDALRASTSWRITAPLRAFKQHLLNNVSRRPRQSPRDKVDRSTRTISDDSEKHVPSVALDAKTPLVLSAPNELVPIATAPMDITAPARLIAFYLPQFHPIPENDAWWGRGFTEWTNVTRATPQFVGHYQPHLPAELGFYDLRVPEIQERQAELAKLYGLHGFCFYFYWFAGKRLLETPIRQWRDNRNIDLPYCLCWANENWSRRWDGLDSEILIAQAHSAEDDIAFIAHVAEYLRDPRYIRVNDKPLLLIYRPSLLPDPRETAARWRDWCRANGIGDIYLAYTQSFETADPRDYGFDAAIEFPPNNSGPPEITDKIEYINPSFSGKVYDYRVFPERSTAYTSQPYTLFRGVFPSWDNEARRTGSGTVFHGATPALFHAWTRNAVRDTLLNQPHPDKRLVFVNAWNEWAEGAHLEPDRRYGYSWLQSVRNALEDVAAETARNKLILVVHDAYLHGAQFLALSLARTMREELGRSLEIILLGDGPLKSEFEKLGFVHDLSGVDPEGYEARALAARLAKSGASSAICNTTVTGLFLKTLAGAGIRCITLVHEMPELLARYGLERHADAIRRYAALTVFPSELVRRGFPGAGHGHETALRTQGLYKRNGARTAEERQGARDRLRTHFGLSPDAHVVVNVGFADRRKGVDLFVEVGRRVLTADPRSVFIWVGEIEVSLRDEIEHAVADSGLGDRFLFPGFQEQTDDFYAGADVFAITSREDPFPSVVMEALSVAVPVVGFEGAGGFAELLARGCGLLAPATDTDAFARCLLDLLNDHERRRAMGELGRTIVDSEYSFRRYAFDLLAWVDLSFKRVSVIVPNYNYAQCMEERLASIQKQIAPIYEVIVLDDASEDESVVVLHKILQNFGIDHQLIVNESNSGSACRQWLNGVERTRGDVIWIAEADDLSEPDFIREVLSAFTDDSVVMSYCQSQQIGPDGEKLADDYLEYVADIDSSKWRSGYVSDGHEEIRTALSVKNTIPNVSACMFRRDALTNALSTHLDEIVRFRIAGDWATYVRVLQHGKIAFSPRALNKHRRHPRSVTVSSFDARLLREILTMQQLVAKEHGRTPAAAARAANYAQELYEQFGLNRSGVASVQQHEEFGLYF